MPAKRPTSVRLGQRLSAIDKFAADRCITQHAAILFLIDRGLEMISAHPAPTLPEKPTAKEIVAFANDRAAYRSRWAV